ncbi:MAG: transaldolase family protein [Candidatus Caldatribacteriaceae bacterium]
MNPGILKVDPELLEGLKERNPNLEIWWDAHPGFYQVFLSNLKEKGIDEGALSVLHRWMSHNEGGFFFFDGVTTNPPLVLKLLEARPLVIERVKELGQCFSLNGRYSWFDLYWMVGKLGTDKFLSNFYRRGRKFGFVCMQVDPRYNQDEEKMKFQALKLARINPNLMVKIPATRAGLSVMEELVSLGISVNATSCFCVPQVVQVAMAMKRGFEKGQARGVDYSGWRSVITMMIGRWEASPELIGEAKNRGMTLEEEDLRFFGILMAYRATEEVKTLQAPAKVLVCSTRKGPGAGYLHLEEISKLPVVITMNPEAIEWGMTLLRKDRASVPFEVPSSIWERLTKIDFARKSLEADGFSMKDIEASEAQKYNLREFSLAMEKIEGLFS